MPVTSQEQRAAAYIIGSVCRRVGAASFATEIAEVLCFYRNMFFKTVRSVTNKFATIINQIRSLMRARSSPIGHGARMPLIRARVVRVYPYKNGLARGPRESRYRQRRPQHTVSRGTLMATLTMQLDSPQPGRCHHFGGFPRPGVISRAGEESAFGAAESARAHARAVVSLLYECCLLLQPPSKRWAWPP